MGPTPIRTSFRFGHSQLALTSQKVGPISPSHNCRLSLHHVAPRNPSRLPSTAFTSLLEVLTSPLFPVSTISSLFTIIIHYFLSIGQPFSLLSHTHFPLLFLARFSRENLHKKVSSGVQRRGGLHRSLLVVVDFSAIVINLSPSKLSTFLFCSFVFLFLAEFSR